MALTNPTCALFRLLAQTATTHRTRQTVESAPRRPEKFWLGGRRTGWSLADRYPLCLWNGTLTVCPSFWPCRKILNDLSSEEVTRTEGKDSSPASTGITVPTTTQIYQTSGGQYCMSRFPSVASTYDSMNSTLAPPTGMSLQLQCLIKKCDSIESTSGIGPAVYLVIVNLQFSVALPIRKLTVKAALVVCVISNCEGK